MLKRILTFALLAACMLSHALADDAAQQLDEAFARYDTLGASVAVFQNGKVTYTYTYGVERADGPKVQPQTAFQVGSISKMVANLGLMQLLDAQGISLDSELGDVLGYRVRHPDYPDTPVTLRQLMTHTAALRDSGDYDIALNGSPRPLSQLLGKRAQYSYVAGREPGMVREYCNFGGGVIGCLIEKLSGQSLDEYMQQHVFAPMGIVAAYQPALIPADVPMADLYHMPELRLAKALRIDGSPVLQPDAETHYTYTAGKLIISAPDLCRLLIALCDGGVYHDVRLLRESVAAEILTPQDHRGSVACRTGHGLFLNIISDDQVQGRTMYGHGGKANGMLCAAYFDPIDRTGVVMLTNGCNNRSVYNGVGMLGRVVMRICYNEVIGSGHEVADAFAVE